jgi:hypothetical protein
VPLRAGHHDGAVGRAERGVGAVELEAGRPATREAEIADDRVLHPLQDPRRPGIVRAGLAAIVRALEEPLRREADAHDPLRRAPVAPPEAAVGAVEGVVVLADLGLPGPDAALGAPHLDDAGYRGAGGDAPVEAVAAVGELAAAVQ